MTKLVEVTFICDECKKKYPVALIGRVELENIELMDFVEKIRDVGWKSNGEDDICPACFAKFHGIPVIG